MATQRKPQVKTAPERMPVVKVWNITDWPVTSVTPANLVVLGQLVRPGTCIQVPVERLKNAKKTQSDRAKGLLAIGDLPKEYLAWKRPPRAQVPASASRAHGDPKVAAEESKKRLAEKRPSKAKVEEAKPSKKASKSTFTVETKKE